MNVKFLRRIFGRLIACAIVLGVGFAGMQALAWMRTPPAQKPTIERALRVEAMAVQPETVQVTLHGYGQVRSLDVVEIAPEVAGKVLSVHPKLEVGEVIPEGEVLFEIDPRDYTARQTEASSQAEQLKKSIDRLQTQYEIDKERVKTLERSRDLAESEYTRLKTLFENDQVGTRSAVDAAERAYHAAEDQVDQLGQAIALYPIRIQEAEDTLESAQAALAMTNLSLDRTKVRAPFTARIKRVALEAGQYVAPGAPVVTLANDSILEISVPLDSREARSWLQFKPGTDVDQEAWFNDVEPVECLITWTEENRASADPANPVGWRGHLHRVEKFDEKTRTVTVAVRVQGEEAISRSGERLPLVDGMFCSVAIPGRTVSDVYRLPRYAVGFTGDVYVASGEVRGGLGFDRASIQDPMALAEHILSGKDPLSGYLRERTKGAIEAALNDVEKGQREALEEAMQLLQKSDEDSIDEQRAAVDEVHARLNAYLSSHSPEERLVTVLVDELNKVLQDDSLYDPERFAHVDIPEDVRGRLDNPATPEDRIRLNRRLLEAAYPNDLGESYRLATRNVDIVRQQGDSTLVRGLDPGSIVVTTRLVNPLQNTLLDVTLLDSTTAPAEVAAL